MKRKQKEYFGLFITGDGTLITTDPVATVKLAKAEVEVEFSGNTLGSSYAPQKGAICSTTPFAVLYTTELPKLVWRKP